MVGAFTVSLTKVNFLEKFLLLWYVWLLCFSWHKLELDRPGDTLYYFSWFGLNFLNRKHTHTQKQELYALRHYII